MDQTHEKPLHLAQQQWAESKRGPIVSQTNQSERSQEQQTTKSDLLALFGKAKGCL
jgi:hypothetical protein